MSSGALRYDRYHVDGRPEWLMRIGPADGAPILFVPPLFEEMNRTRALMAGIMELLGEKGFACALPDLPGTGESERALEACGWDAWRKAVRAASDQVRNGRPLITAALRGGALLDDVADAAHWRLAPVEGRSLLRDLGRSGLAGGSAGAGYPVSPDLTARLAEARPPDVSPCRIVRLTSDPKPADCKYNGPALWRRSEPSTSFDLAEQMASDIRGWACASC